MAKLKSTSGWIIGLLLLCVTIVVLIDQWSQAGRLDTRTVDLIRFLLFLHGTLDQALLWLRTRNHWTLIFLFLYLLVAVYSLVLYYHPDTLFWPLIVVSCLLAVAAVGVLLSGKINPRGRRILELAAQSVRGNSDGFTNRPYPAGKAEYTREELNAFARFMMKHLAASCFFRKEGVIFVIYSNPFAYVALSSLNIYKKTYLFFGYNGQVSVKIAGRDYRKYNETLSFDGLCRSLGQLFKRFLMAYQQGHAKEILAVLRGRGGMDDL